jgi:hypothetical protein
MQGSNLSSVLPQTHAHLLPVALILLQARLCRRQSAAWQAALQ